MQRTILALGLVLLGGTAWANPPVASYIFPAGGQRGTTVKVHVGGLFLHKECNWEMTGAGVTLSKSLHSIPTKWFEGPILPLPDSQRAEDYPRDMAGEAKIGGDAALGIRKTRVWTSEGAAGGLSFMVGELPEIVEDEMDGDPVPVPVNLPVTINGRIFPRDDIDDWAITAKKGEIVHAEVHAARIGSPLDSRLEILAPDGRVLAENDDTFGTDSFVSLVAPADGTYRVRIQDTQRKGGQDHVYRLTLTKGPRIGQIFPLGGRKGSKLKAEVNGPGVPPGSVEVTLPDTVGLQRVQVPAGSAQSSILLDLDDLPELIQTSPAPDRVVTVPSVLNGRISRPGEASTWSIAAQKGVAIQLELRARILGSHLQGNLEILDSADKVLAQATSTGKNDPVLLFQPPADGTYRVRIRDRFRARGGPAFAYRLRVTPAEPDFSLVLATDAFSSMFAWKVSYIVRKCG